MKDKNSKFCSNCGSQVITNKKRIVFVIVVVLFLLWGVPILSFLVSYHPKKSITSLEFQNFMNGVGCETKKQVDVNNIVGYYVEKKASCNFNLKYMEINDRKIHDLYFHSIIQEIKNHNTTIKEGITVNDNFNQYYEYYLKGNYSAIFVSNHNTIIYGFTDLEYEDAFLDILTKMGYHDNNAFYDSTFALLNTVMVIYLIIFCIFIIICFWKIYKKMGKPGWTSLIPIYNLYILIKVLLGKGWYLLFSFIPIINLFFFLYLLIKLGKSFGKEGTFLVFMALLPFIFIPILAFDNSKHIIYEKKKACKMNF